MFCIKPNLNSNLFNIPKNSSVFFSPSLKKTEQNETVEFDVEEDDDSKSQIADL